MGFSLETFEPGYGWVEISEHSSLFLATREMSEQAESTTWNLRIKAWDGNGQVRIYKDGSIQTISIGNA